MPWFQLIAGMCFLALAGQQYVQYRCEAFTTRRSLLPVVLMTLAAFSMIMAHSMRLVLVP